MRVLVAEDDAVSALFLERLLKREGIDVELARDGLEALAALGRERFDVLLTDWMMPNLDGIELTRRVHTHCRRRPLVVVVTALASDEARAYALAAGADAYLAKPLRPEAVLEALRTGLERLSQPAPAPDPEVGEGAAAGTVPFVGVAFAASAGGPSALAEVLAALPAQAEAAYFAVLHGPDWLLETFARTLEARIPLEVFLVRSSDAPVKPRTVYLAPGDRHLLVSPDLCVQLSDEPPVNFVRPAADPLFRSVARVFGRHAVGVVLTGMGRDGSRGAAAIASTGGVVIAQDPVTALAPTMPATVVELGVARTVAPLPELAAALAAEIGRLEGELQAGLRRRGSPAAGPLPRGGTR